jgi:hypothetical protein
MDDWDAIKAGIVRNYATLRLSESTRQYAEQACRELSAHEPLSDLVQLVKAETERMQKEPA